MVTVRRLAFLLLVSLMVLPFTGCGRSDLPELGEVHGRVTLDGKPAAGAIISFCPEEGRPAVANVQSDGSYELTFVHGVKGAKVGPNSVSIAWSEIAEAFAPFPAKYSSDTQLTADVKPGDNTFDFDLKSTD
jgi:hypothetical protein